MARKVDTFYELSAYTRRNEMVSRAYAARKSMAKRAARIAEKRGFTIVISVVKEHASGRVDRDIIYRTSEKLVDFRPFDFDERTSDTRKALVRDAAYLPQL